MGWVGCWRGDIQGMGKYTCMRENRAGAGGGADFGEGQGGLDTHGGAGGDDEGLTKQGARARCAK
jgi:hypothetical protein